MLEQAIAEKIENQVKLDIPQIAIVSEYKLGQKVEGYANALEVVEAQMANNPDASFEQVLQSLIEAGIIEK